MRKRAARGVGVVIAMLTTCARPSLAQTPPKESAADRLFEEGKKLWDDPQRWREGCERFAAAHGLDPSASSAVKLARCENRTAQPARAHRLYDEAIRRAEGDPTLSADRRRELDTLARTERKALVGIAFLSGEHLLAGTAVSVDGEPLDRVGTVPAVVASGSHRVRLVLVGRQPEERTLVLGEHETADLVWSPLPEPIATVPPAIAPAPPPARPSIVPAATLAAGGVVFAGAAGYFAYRTDASLREAKPACDPRGSCSPAGVALRDDARADQTRAIVAGGVGAALIGVGAVLYWRARRTDLASGSRTWAWLAQPGGASVEGTF